jgi:hypothetical protein
MISNGIVRCLNALGIVAKEQRLYEIVIKKINNVFQLSC